MMSDGEFVEMEVESEQIAEAFISAPTSHVPAVNTAGGAAQEYIGAQHVAVKRDVVNIQQRLKVLAAMAGSSWFYRYPVKSNGRTMHIEGPSIKLANDLAREYGNCNVDVRAMDEGDNWVFYARFHDLESGYSLTRAFQQQKGQQTIGGKDEGRKLDIVFQIGQSKAIRNVIVNALQTFSDFAFEEAKSNLVTKIGHKLEFYRDKALSRLQEMNIDLGRVERVVGRTSGDWLATDLARVIAEIQAISDGMATADDTYPRDKPDDGATAETSLDNFAKKPAAKKAKKAKAKAEDKPAAKPKDDASDKDVSETEAGDDDKEILSDLEKELGEVQNKDELDGVLLMYKSNLEGWTGKLKEQSEKSILDCQERISA